MGNPDVANRISKAIIIDPKARTLRYTQVDVKRDGSLRAIVGGYIEAAYSWPSGDVLYVNEEGLLHPAAHFFRLSLRGDALPIAGTGVIVGREILEDIWQIIGDVRHLCEGEWTGNADVALTIEELAPLITFLDRAQADAYAAANASNTAASLTAIHDDGTHEVVSRTSVREFWNSVPREEDQ